MTLPVPINRTELYLAKIAGEDVTIPDRPINNTEVFLARLAGADIVLPTPINTLQVWLAILCGEQYTTPPVQGAELIGVQMVRTEFLAASAGVDGITTPTPENRAEEYWAKIAEELSVHTITVKGTSLHLLHIVSGIEDFQYVYGDTEQTKYSGKNILCLNNDNIALNGSSSGKVTLDFVDNVASLTTISDLSAASFAYYYTQELDSTKTYAFSVLIKKIAGTTTNRISFSYSDDGTTWAANTTQDFTISVGGSQSYSKVFNGHSYYRFGLYACTNSGTVVGDKTDYTDLQLELGSTATSYEPYVGGTASPNPDYPQDVHVVTGSQVVNMHGKNLFNKNNAVSGSYLRNDGTESATALWAVTDYIAITPNTAYTLSGVSGGVGVNPSRCYYDADKNFISGVKHNSNTDTTFTDTSPNGAYYMRENLRVADIATTQIEKGSTATAYEPNTDYSLTLGSLELCKIGDYQDYIYKSGDDWYVHKATKNVTLVGTENWTYASTSAMPYRLAVSDAANFSESLDVPPDVFVNRYTPVAWNAVISSGIKYAVTGGTNRTIAFRNTDVATLDDWKTWVSNNNLIVYYRLRTATDTKITDATLVSQLNALDSAILPTPEAFVTVSGNLPAPIQFTYQGKL